MDFSWLSPPFFSPPPSSPSIPLKTALLFFMCGIHVMALRSKSYRVYRRFKNIYKYVCTFCAKFFCGKFTCWKKWAQILNCRGTPFSPPPPPLSTGMISFRPQFTTFSLTALSRTYNKTEKKEIPPKTHRHFITIKAFSEKKNNAGFFLTAQPIKMDLRSHHDALLLISILELSFHIWEIGLLTNSHRRTLQENGLTVKLYKILERKGLSKWRGRFRLFLILGWALSPNWMCITLTLNFHLLFEKDVHIPKGIEAQEIPKKGKCAGYKTSQSTFSHF